jgi:hypothetical protein
MAFFNLNRSADWFAEKRRRVRRNVFFVLSLYAGCGKVFYATVL